jgi:hypothetical protein
VRQPNGSRSPHLKRLGRQLSFISLYKKGLCFFSFSLL